MKEPVESDWKVAQVLSYDEESTQLELKIIYQYKEDIPEEEDLNAFSKSMMNEGESEVEVLLFSYLITPKLDKAVVL